MAGMKPAMTAGCLLDPLAIRTDIEGRDARDATHEKSLLTVDWFLPALTPEQGSRGSSVG